MSDPTSMLVFSQPALLAGLALAGVPVLVHLLLRQRPRRIVFPALSLLRPAISAGQRASRLRNLVLLLVRASLLALAALLLAGPTCEPQGGRFIGDEPLFCVLVVDDSVSTAYQVHSAGQSAAGPAATWFSLLRQQALAMAEKAADWPDGSELALVLAAPGSIPTGPTRDCRRIVEALRSTSASAERSAPASAHAAALGQALRVAASLLRASSLAARRLVVFTDGTAAAWRDVSPEILSGLAGLQVRVVVPPNLPASNLSLVAAEGPRRRHPVTAPLSLRATAFAQGVDSEVFLSIRQADRLLAREGPVKLTDGVACDAVLELPPMGPGPVGLVLELEPKDRLDIDQRRYVVFETAPPPVVWLVPTAAGSRDLSTLIVQNLLSPTVLPAEQQLVRTKVVDSRLVDSDAIRDPAPVLVVVMSGPQEPTVAPAVLRELERGASVLLVPSSDARQCDWPGLRELVAAEPPALVETDTVAMYFEPQAEAAGVPELAELARCAVRRRLALAGLREGARVEARYTDGSPAIVVGRRGSGKVIVLSTSPDPDWSDLGVRAAGLLTWLHFLIDSAVGPPESIRYFNLGEPAYEPFANLPADGLVRVVLLSAPEVGPCWVRLRSGKPIEAWPTQRVGLYAIYAGAAEPVAMYAVNVPAQECRLERIGAEAIAAQLGLQRVEVVEVGSGGAGAEAATRGSASRPAPREVLAVLLLALFVGELLLSNLRRPEQKPGPVAA